MKSNAIRVFAALVAVTGALQGATTYERVLRPYPAIEDTKDAGRAHPINNIDVDRFFDVNQGAIRTVDLMPDLLKAARSSLKDTLCDTGCPDDKSSYYLIHVLKWNGPVSSDGKKSQFSVDKQNWYVYNKGKSWSREDFATNYRVFGARKLYFLYVHLGAPDPAYYTEYRSRYVLQFVPKTPDNVLHLLSLASLFIGANPTNKAAEVPKPASVWGGGHFDNLTSPSDVTVTAAFTGVDVAPGKDPAAAQPQPPAAADGDADRAASGPSAAEPVATTVAPAPAPAPAPVTPVAQTAPAQKPSPTIDNEGLYWWDVSVGVPIRKISQTVVDTTANTITAKTVDKQNLFALLDLYPFYRRDTKRQTFSFYPYVVTGVPVAQQPLHKVLIGAGFGPYFANVYAGALFVKQPQVGAGPGVSASAKFETQFAFGLNIGVKSTMDLLSKAKKN